jgi:hypothetical protein
MSRTRRPAGVAGLIALVTLVSACGSSAPAGTGGANSATGGAQTAVKFAECMRRNGVGQFPDPDSSGKLTIDGVVNGSSLNPSAPAFKQALNACRDLEPAGFMGRKRSAAEQTVALRFAECMRRNGVKDFADPTPNGPLIDVSGAHSIPGFEAAARKCLAVYRGRLGITGP